MKGYRVLQPGLTFCKAVRHQGEVVPESAIPYGLLERLRAEAPEVGDIYREVLEHVEVEEASLIDLLLSAEAEEEVEVVGDLRLVHDIQSGLKIWRGQDGRPRCGYPLGEGVRCGQIVSPGGKCRHHRK